MICFYHSSDLDGHCSGALVKHFFPDCQMVGLNYDKLDPLRDLDQYENLENREVYMVDFCPDDWSLMEELYKQCKVIHIIDHHKTTIDRVQNGMETKTFECEGMFTEELSACELVWAYINPEIPAPTFVSLLGRWDVWDHDSIPGIREFQHGLRQYVTDPEHVDYPNIWDALFQDEQDKTRPLMKEIMKEGHTIMRYMTIQNRKIIESCAFETNFEGLKCIALNMPFAHSDTFEVIDTSKYDAHLVFYRIRGAWKISLYSGKNVEGETTVDLSEIATRHGGGGHKGAASWYCTKLAFDVPDHLDS